MYCPKFKVIHSIFIQIRYNFLSIKIIKLNFYDFLNTGTVEQASPNIKLLTIG